MTAYSHASSHGRRSKGGLRSVHAAAVHAPGRGGNTAATQRSPACVRAPWLSVMCWLPANRPARLACSCCLGSDERLAGEAELICATEPAAAGAGSCGGKHAGSWREFGRASVERVVERFCFAGRGGRSLEWGVEVWVV